MLRVVAAVAALSFGLYVFAQDEEKIPLRKPVGRRRLRSVMQDLMYLATRLTHHARRLGLSFSNAFVTDSRCSQAC